MHAFSFGAPKGLAVGIASLVSAPYYNRYRLCRNGIWAEIGQSKVISMSSEDIRIELTQEVTPEVVEGLKLYARLASRDFDSGLYWFRSNPYGSGLHGLAIHQRKVIGYYSLIPTEMCLAGTTLIGAKGEFLAVEECYRNKHIKTSRMPLAFDLVKTTTREASRYGIEAVLAVASGPAALCHRFSGAKTFEFPHRHFFTFFRTPEYVKNPLKRALIQSGLLSVPRTWVKLKSFINRDKNDISLTRVRDLNADNFHGSRGTNRLVNQSSKMINFRFPAEDYLKYLTCSNNTDYLIFTNPMYEARVLLKDWSGLDLQRAEFGAIFRDLFEQCRMHKAESVELYVPSDNQKVSYLLRGLGFLSRNCSLKFQLYCSDSIIRDLDCCSWELTHAHIGYV